MLTACEQENKTTADERRQQKKNMATARDQEDVTQADEGLRQKNREHMFTLFQ